MNQLLRTFVRALPLAGGVVLTLISLNIIVDLGRFDLDDEDFWAFVFFGMVGIPLLVAGVHFISTHQEDFDR